MPRRISSVPWSDLRVFPLYQLALQPPVRYHADDHCFEVQSYVDVGGNGVLTAIELVESLDEGGIVQKQPAATTLLMSSCSCAREPGSRRRLPLEPHRKGPDGTAYIPRDPPTIAISACGATGDSGPSGTSRSR